MTTETVTAGLRHWFARARGSAGGAHLALCHEKVRRLGVRLGFLQQPEPVLFEINWDDVRESLREAGRVENVKIHFEPTEDPWAGIPEDQEEDPDREAPQEEVERVAQLAGEQAGAGARDLLEKLTKLHEHEVALEAEALKRELRARAADCWVSPAAEYILELIARLRMDPIAVPPIDEEAEAERRAEELIEKVRAEAPPPMDPILAFLVYMEDWLGEEGAPLDEGAARHLLAAAKEQLRQGLLGQLEAYEVVLKDQLEPKDCPEKDRDVQDPYPGHCEAEHELNRLATELVQRYPHEMRPDEDAVDMALRLMVTWGSLPATDETLDTHELVEAVRDFLHATVDEHNILSCGGFTNPRVARIYFALRALGEEIFQNGNPKPSIRGTRPTAVITDDLEPVEDTMPPEQVERLMGIPFRKVEPYPDPRRHEKFAATGCERCPVEPEAAPMEFPTEVNEVGPDGYGVGPEKVEYVRKEPDTYEALGARVFQNRPPIPAALAEALKRQVAETDPAPIVLTVEEFGDKVRAAALAAVEPNRCEQVERLNSRAVRDEAGRVYVRHLTVAPPGEDTIVGPMLRLGNLLELVELAAKNPHSIFEPRFIERTVEKARKEVELLGKILSP